MKFILGLALLVTASNVFAYEGLKNFAGTYEGLCAHQDVGSADPEAVETKINFAVAGMAFAVDVEKPLSWAPLFLGSTMFYEYRIAGGKVTSSLSEDKKVLTIVVDQKHRNYHGLTKTTYELTKKGVAVSVVDTLKSSEAEGFRELTRTMCVLKKM